MKQPKTKLHKTIQEEDLRAERDHFRLVRRISKQYFSEIFIINLRMYLIENPVHVLEKETVYTIV